MKSFHSRSHRLAPEREPTTRAPAERPAGMERADVLMVARKLAASRTLARRLIEGGVVRSEFGVIEKASQLLPLSAHLMLNSAPSQEAPQDLDET